MAKSGLTIVPDNLFTYSFTGTGQESQSSGAVSAYISANESGSTNTRYVVRVKDPSAVWYMEPQYGIVAIQS